VQLQGLTTGVAKRRDHHYEVEKLRITYFMALTYRRWVSYFHFTSCNAVIWQYIKGNGFILPDWNSIIFNIWKVFICKERESSSELLDKQAEKLGMVKIFQYIMRQLIFCQLELNYLSHVTCFQKKNSLSCDEFLFFYVLNLSGLEKLPARTVTSNGHGVSCLSS